MIEIAAPVSALALAAGSAHFCREEASGSSFAIPGVAHPIARRAVRCRLRAISPRRQLDDQTLAQKIRAHHHETDHRFRPEIRDIGFCSNIAETDANGTYETDGREHTECDLAYHVSDDGHLLPNVRGEPRAAAHKRLSSSENAVSSGSPVCETAGPVS